MASEKKAGEAGMMEERVAAARMAVAEAGVVHERAVVDSALECVL